MFWLCVVAQTCNLNPWEAEAKGLQIQDWSKLYVLRIKFQKGYAINPEEHAQTLLSNRPSHGNLISCKSKFKR